MSNLGDFNAIYSETSLIEKYGSMPLEAVMALEITSEALLLASKLLWPDFQVVEGCVLLSQRANQATLSRWRTHFQGNLRSCELIMNKTMLHTFLADGTTAQFGLLRYVAALMRQTWTAKLEKEFPERDLGVQVHEDSENEEIVVTFARREAE